MTDSPIFKIDRTQRIHSGGIVVRVYQVVGTEQYGWDTNRGEASADERRFDSCAAAQQAADEALQTSGHTCKDACYSWRALM